MAESAGRCWAFGLVVLLGCMGTDSGNQPVPAPSCEGTQPLSCRAPEPAENLQACVPLGTDYQPRKNQSAQDSWPACISDDNLFHPINDSISTIARVGAFEEMALYLWDNGCPPSTDDFVQARVIYSQEQGLDSRMQRREDVHYAVPAGGAKCSESGVPESNPDRCVGPAKLLPILNDAFQKGAAGEQPVVQARRIEAALLWFLYVSVLSEVTSCTAAPRDCDSAWAYYGGGQHREAPKGLGRYVRSLSQETHDRAYDGILAERCWRNLDNETGIATDLALRDRAREQIDRAMLRGVARVARGRLLELKCATGASREGQLAFLATLLPLLDRASTERDPVSADILRTRGLTPEPTSADIDAAVGALDALFECP